VLSAHCHVLVVVMVDMAVDKQVHLEAMEDMVDIATMEVAIQMVATSEGVDKIHLNKVAMAGARAIAAIPVATTAVEVVSSTRPSRLRPEERVGEDVNLKQLAIKKVAIINLELEEDKIMDHLAVAVAVNLELEEDKIMDHLVVVVAVNLELEEDKLMSHLVVAVAVNLEAVDHLVGANNNEALVVNKATDRKIRRTPAGDSTEANPIALQLNNKARMADGGTTKHLFD